MATLTVTTTYEWEDDAPVSAPAAPKQGAWEPITRGQRRHMFLLFSSVFGHTEDAARYAFTRLVLGVDPDYAVSWSDNKPGALSSDEAARVIAALDFLDV